MTDPRLRGLVVEFKVPTQKLQELMSDIIHERSNKVKAGLGPTMATWVSVLNKEIQAVLAPHDRTGRLRKTTTALKPRRFHLGWFIPVVTAAKTYAYRQEIGGVVKAKSSKGLSIPLSPVLDSRGVPKHPLSYYVDRKDTFWKKIRGRLFLMRKIPKQKDPVALWVFQKQIDIQRHPQWISKSLERSLPALFALLRKAQQ